MYEAYWQLRGKPFGPAGAESFFASEVHQAAALKLRYALDSRHAACALVGPCGIGKSLLIERLLAELPESTQPRLRVVFPQMPAEALVRYIAAEVIGQAYAAERIDQNIRRLGGALQENARKGRHAVLVVDEAHLLTAGDVFETLRLLLNFEHCGNPTWTLVLVGQPGVLLALQRKPDLEQRVGVKCLMRAFRREETADYVAHRLQAVGAAQPIFDAGALTTLHELSGGIPRRINRLADLCLLIGFAEELPGISAEQVESVSDELVAVRPE